MPESLPPSTPQPAGSPNPGEGRPQPSLSPDQIRHGAGWLSGAGAEADVVVSSRVRLARNFEGFPFLSRASLAQRQALLDLARQRIMSARPADKLLWVHIHRATALDRTLMVERHLISRDHAKGHEPRGVAISLPDEQLSIMVNEEDHLRIQVIRPGLALENAFAQIDKVDDQLARHGGADESAGDAAAAPGQEGPGFAYDDRFGYLTACPTNVGTGIRVSVMLHLPAIRLMGELEKVKRAARDMSLAVRGYYGEGSDNVGDFYQVSNQTTLGKSERVILHELSREILPKVLLYERASRQQLLSKRRRWLEDQVLRALGTLRYARLLTAEESLTLLSYVRLGILTELIPDVRISDVNQLLLLTQPAHLQRVAGRVMDQNERREARADLVRRWLGGEKNPNATPT